MIHALTHLDVLAGSANVALQAGDSKQLLRLIPDNAIDAIVTDPPYELGFMGKGWDKTGIANDPELWAECLRVLKPGGYLLAFSGSRTYHRMACAIEDGGFEVRDQIMWVYGSGMPKSHDVSKAIDKQDASAERRKRRLRFTAWVRSTGLTSAQIDKITGSCMGTHYLTDKSQPLVAIRDHFELLRPHFDGPVPEWVEQLVNERTVESENFKRREVVGTAEMRDTSEIRIACAESANGHDGAARREVAITAAATEAAKEWEGWGTALKPAHEPICVARKPFPGTVAANVLEWGVGAINIDACRVDGGERPLIIGAPKDGNYAGEFRQGSQHGGMQALGRWPANLIHDGSPEVVAMFSADAGARAPVTGNEPSAAVAAGGVYNQRKRVASPRVGVTDFAMAPGERRLDIGSAARFFYCAKASRKDRNDGLESSDAPVVATGATMRECEDADWSARNGNDHPTVKPTSLMQYLVRLVARPGAVVLDPFNGSGSTGRGARLEGCRYIGFDLDQHHIDISERRIAAAEATAAKEAAGKAETAPAKAPRKPRAKKAPPAARIEAVAPPAPEQLSLLEAA